METALFTQFYDYALPTAHIEKLLELESLNEVEKYCNENGIKPPVICNLPKEPV